MQRQQLSEIKSILSWGVAIGLALGLFAALMLQSICGDWAPVVHLLLLLLIWFWMKRYQ